MNKIVSSFIRMTMLAATLVLAGCTYDQILKLPNVPAALKGDKAAQAAFLADLTDPKKPDLLTGMIAVAYGPELVYLPNGWEAMLKRDGESVLALILGVHLSRDNVTYAQVQALDVDVDEATFNRYKTFGANWRKSIVNDPKNAYLTERLALFKARTGSSNYGDDAHNWAEVHKLLRNDAEFRTFLTDDRMAATWLARNQSVLQQGFVKERHMIDFLHHLGPINSGALPNASP
ncbi:MAG: hypothetical protein O9315_17440 [Beijerinckiaceae bacterium]|nr:hypothetical protein [Brevundimonas sp.]MCZ8302029.1 hypothetical protein [Beijerinckiaceae bacterium]